MPRLVVCFSILAATAVAAPGAQAPAKHFLWTVTAPGAPPSYLLGSLHVLTPDYYPLSPRIDQAFAASKVLIQEADMDELTDPATVMSVAVKALLAEGRTLDQVIAPDLYRQVMERADKIGLPRAALQQMKPWLVAITLTAPAMRAAGFELEHGVDKHFFDRAKKLGHERRALETVAFQFDRLDQMSAADQEAMLRATIEDLETQISNVKTIANAWQRGDTATLEKLLLAATASSPELHKRLIIDRNTSWVSEVETCFKQQTSCFVVVGAAHLVGPDSLVALLQKKGYKVEQQ